MEDEIRPFPIAALAATLDRAAQGEDVPPLWHWTHFLVAAPRSKLAVDGHPQRGEFMPPISLPRRMWAGGSVVFHSPLRLGDRAERTSTIRSIVEKQGATGPLMFVKVAHSVKRGSELLIEEEQDVVYRAPATASTQTRPSPAPASSTWIREFVADPVLLFRYSALTFNSHRIHFDHAYAHGAEGYPGLVVHGPLLATLLAGLAQETAAERRLRKLTYRAKSPVFANEHVHICGKPGREPDQVELWVERNGTVVMSASALLGEQ